MADARTLLVERDGQALLEVPCFRAAVRAGVDAGRNAESVDGRITIGTAEDATLVLTDPTVSRFHLELEATSEGIVIRDLGSTNGTWLGSSGVKEIVARAGLELLVGKTRIALELGDARSELAVSSSHGFGDLVGMAPAMRAMYGLLERAAPTTAPVLLTGESGTGKELAARALHHASPRKDEAFEIVDCGGLPAALIESELFGHDRGAFTSAHREHAGAFERATGGTIFLDEIGELPLEVQPKLLRVLAEGEIRRVGGSNARQVDVRVIAATHRDLRREVNSGRFRADLFYRLAVIQVRMPALRDRLEDLGLLVRSLIETIVDERKLALHVEPDPALVAELARHTWPGNVRELRNYLEQLLILQRPPDLAPTGDTENDTDLTTLPLRAAKERLIERFERTYLERVLRETAGNVTEAARRAGVDRGTLFRTIRRLGLRS